MGQNVFNGSGSHRELMQKAYDRFEQHENALTEKLLAFLRSKAPKVRIIGLPTLTEEYQGLTYSRVATVSFVVEGFQTPDIVSHIDNYNIGIRHGDYYACIWSIRSVCVLTVVSPASPWRTTTRLKKLTS
ncbi:hypothetical protein AeNC1_008475 [Aphanomyces euteiches]|nr:hypothetical protein AeNC1_008475 [Aphanomyces euteiches]